MSAYPSLHLQVTILRLPNYTLCTNYHMLRTRLFLALTTHAPHAFNSSLEGYFLNKLLFQSHTVLQSHGSSFMELPKEDSWLNNTIAIIKSKLSVLSFINSQ